jgi:hypothetical protein
MSHREFRNVENGSLDMVDELMQETMYLGKMVAAIPAKRHIHPSAIGDSNDDGVREGMDKFSCLCHVVGAKYANSVPLRIADFVWSIMHSLPPYYGSNVSQTMGESQGLFQDKVKSVMRVNLNSLNLVACFFLVGVDDHLE